MIPHDAPSAQQLVEAVREWLEREVMTSTTGRLQFNARVAVNVLSMVERELLVGADQAAAHAERLAQLGAGLRRALQDNREVFVNIINKTNGSNATLQVTLEY